MEQVKPNLYVVRGPFDPCAPGGCNGRNVDDGLLHEPGDVAVRVTPEGAIVVDDKFVQNVPKLKTMNDRMRELVRRKVPDGQLATELKLDDIGWSHTVSTGTFMRSIVRYRNELAAAR